MKILREYLEKRSARNDLIHFLQTVSYFKDLSLRALKILVSQFEAVYIPSGETLINQGEQGDSLFIVQSGRLITIKQKKDGTQEILGEIQRGEVIGELSLITDAPRAATIVAVRDSVLWKLSKLEFNHFVKDNAIYILPLLKEAILRLTHPPKPRVNNVTVIAIAPAGSSPTDKIFIQELVEALTSTGKTLYLNSTTLQEKFPEYDFQSITKIDIVHRNIIHWLNTQEYNHEFLIYETDNHNSNWTKFFLRQADRVLLIGDALGSPQLNEIEQSLFESNKIKKQIDIVLLHSENLVLPSNTSIWLKERPVGVYHIRKNTEEDIKRLIRFIKGKEIALVLAGGGARGLAHLGVAKAFAELGIPIDRLGGTSAGALSAAFLAFDYPLEEIIHLIEEVVFKIKLNDYTIPKVALLEGSSWIKGLKRCFGEHTCLEDLLLPMFCIASNLTTRKMEVLTRGLIYKAIRASISIPGIAPPISNEKDELLIDGGLFNNFPVDVMRHISPSANIFAVTVQPPKYIHAHLPEGVYKGFQGIFKKTKPDQNKVPNIAEIIVSALVLCNDQREATMQQQADYYLSMEISQVGFLEFSKVRELIEIGYRKTMEEFAKNPPVF